MADDVVGITFHESMKGPFAIGETEPREGAERGEREDSTLTMRATIVIPDIRAFASDPRHEGTIAGEVEYPPLGGTMRATRGVFRLFSPAEQPRTKHMVYELACERAGRPFYLAGRKEVRDDPGLDLWADTTTLYTRLHDGGGTDAPVIGAGILRLGATDFAALLSTIRAVNAPSPVRAADAVTSFGRFFAGELWDTYARG